MTTACGATLNSSFLAFPRNLGVSPGAKAVGRQARELQEISDQSVTIGWHHREMVRRLGMAIAKSSVDDWDGYGAKAVDLDSVPSAIWFARLLPMHVPIPDIYVDPDGEIAFEWYLGPRRVFSVTVRRNDELAYAGLFGVNKIYGVEYLDDELPETVLDNIFRVFSEQLAYGTSEHG
jgi:hypothetical protein